MSAQDNLNEEQFKGPWYHGTNVEIEPTNFIEPGHGKNFGEGKSDHVYFTESVAGAHGYAKFAAAQRGGEPHVYEVEPGHGMPWRKVGGNRAAGSAREYKIRDQVRVTREVKG